jgi:hypothetical protein
MATAVEPPQTAPDEPQEPPQETAAAGRSREDLFEYSRWLHVGEGALTCEHNSEVEEHGRSVVRASGACTEADLDDLRDPALRPVLVEEILDQTAHEVYAEATRTVEDLDDEGADPDDDGKLPKLYADINQDREEYARQQELAEDERNAEEYAALTQRLADYSRAVNEEIDRLQKPRREALEAKTTEAIIEIIRRGRIDQIGTEEYLHTFNAWQWYVCTFKPTLRGVPRERLFSDISVFKHQTPPRVIAVLSQSFGELEANMARGRGLGN